MWSNRPLLITYYVPDWKALADPSSGEWCVWLPLGETIETSAWWQAEEVVFAGCLQLDLRQWYLKDLQWILWVMPLLLVVSVSFSFVLGGGAKTAPENPAFFTFSWKTPLCGLGRQDACCRTEPWFGPPKEKAP